MIYTQLTEEQIRRLLKEHEKKLFPDDPHEDGGPPLFLPDPAGDKNNGK